MAPETGLPHAADIRTGEAPDKLDDPVCARLRHARAQVAGKALFGSIDPDQAAAELQQQRAMASQQLRLSQDAQYLHAAALLESGRRARLQLLTRALQLTPHDPHLLWDAARFCLDAREAVPCPLAQWEARLLQADAQNSEVWAMVAAQREREGRPDRALQAMQQAGSVAESSTYWVASVELAQRALGTVSEQPFADQVGMAFAVAAEVSSNHGMVVNMCRQQSARSAPWGQACLRYGQVLEAQGDSMLARAVGLGLQALALKSLGELRQMAEVEARSHRLRAGLMEQADVVALFAVLSPAHFEHYLQRVKRDGEREANARIHQQLAACGLL